jgi:hypothetical protein
MKKITLNEYITASGRYPDRLNSSELTKSVKTNATTLLEKVNALLLDLGVSGPFSVSSGFRPSAVNGATPNAAKGSLHQSGQAIDIVDDKKQTLAKLVQSKPELLKKHGLWLEHPNNTIGKNTNWCHLDMDSTIRKDRPVRVFIPA